MSFADLLGTYKAIKEKQQDDASSSDSDIDGPNARPSSKRGPPLEEFARMRKRQDKKRTIRHFSATGSGRGDARAPVRHPKPAASGKLALMFIIIDELPHEAVWRRWLQHGQDEVETRAAEAAATAHRRRLASGSSGSANGDDSCTDGAGCVGCRVLIHAKHPERVRSQWVRRHLLPVSFRPEWGSIELVRAALALMQVAYAGEGEGVPGCERFALVSESCIPIVSFADATRAMWADGRRSWCHAWNRAESGNEEHNANCIDSAIIPRDDVWKSDQWVMLARKHVRSILELPRRVGAAEGASLSVAPAGTADTASHTVSITALMQPALWPAFANVFAADELYIPTCLALLGALAAPVSSSSHSSATSSHAQARFRGDTPSHDDVTRRMLTYVDWPRPRAAKSPRTFASWAAFVSGSPGNGRGNGKGKSKSAGCLQEALALGCVFARKFSADGVPLEQWADVVLYGGASWTIGALGGGDRRRTNASSPRSDGRSAALMQAAPPPPGSASMAADFDGRDNHNRKRKRTSDWDLDQDRNRERDRDRDRDRDRKRQRHEHERKPGQKRFLVIVCAGDDSLHYGRWDSGGNGDSGGEGTDRCFDLCLNYFGSNEATVAKYTERLRLPASSKSTASHGRVQSAAAAPTETPAVAMNAASAAASVTAGDGADNEDGELEEGEEGELDEDDDEMDNSPSMPTAAEAPSAVKPPAREGYSGPPGHDRLLRYKGPKWGIVRQILSRHIFWRSYDYVWMPDDDVEVSVVFIVFLETCAASPNLFKKSSSV